MTTADLIRAPRKFIMPVAGGPARVVRWGETLDEEALAFALRAGYVTAPPSASAAPSAPALPVADDAPPAQWIASGE